MKAFSFPQRAREGKCAIRGTPVLRECFMPPVLRECLIQWTGPGQSQKLLFYRKKNLFYRKIIPLTKEQ